jgi:hypothetical protein
MCNKRVSKLRQLLLIGLSSTLIACTTTMPKPYPLKPTLNIQKVDGGMCLSKEDTAKLGKYILELERR